MDQTASADQSIFLNFPERGQIPSLNRGLRLRPSCHRQEATASQGQSV